jgi:hypothetical protein
MTAVFPRQYWGGHTDTEDTDPADEDWIQLHASEWGGYRTMSVVAPVPSHVDSLAR